MLVPDPWTSPLDWSTAMGGSWLVLWCLLVANGSGEGQDKVYTGGSAYSYTKITAATQTNPQPSMQELFQRSFARICHDLNLVV